jgi:hypothetical protein
MADRFPGRAEKGEEAYFKEVVCPALVRLLAGLEQSTKDLDRWPAEGAAVALAATLTFIKNMNFDLRYQSPLEIALELVEKTIDPESLVYCKRAQAAVADLDSIRKSGLAPLDDFRKKELPRKDVNRIVASVAVDCLLLSKFSLPEALKKVVGPSSAAAEELKNFRENLRRIRSGPKRDFYKETADLFKDLPPKQAGAAAIVLYHFQLGKKSKGEWDFLVREKADQLRRGRAERTKP